MYILSLGKLGLCREELYIADLSEEAIPEVLEVSPIIEDAFPFATLLDVKLIQKTGVKVNGVIITPDICNPYGLNN